MVLQCRAPAPHFAFIFITLNHYFKLHNTNFMNLMTDKWFNLWFLVLIHLFIEDKTRSGNILYCQTVKNVL